MSLITSDLIPDEFNYNQYLRENNIFNLVREDEPIDASKKYVPNITFSVDPNNKEPFPTEFDDLARLHYIVRSRKVTTILEFGVGKSTPVLCDALKKNQNKYLEFTSNNLRRGNLYECHSIDNNKEWLDLCRINIPKDFLDKGISFLHLSKLITSEFNNKLCTYYDPLPNLCPDLIYLDGPDQFSAIGNVRGLSTNHQDRMPMAADILTFEHFLQPGTLIVVDGRTANARFLKTNFQRNWAHCYSSKWDQHYFECQEEPLGIFNKKMIEHCLNEKYAKRLSRK